MLALIAGTVSYLHMHLPEELHGQPGWVAVLTPLSVDGRTGGDREAPGDSGGLEVADLLHPPDVQLQVRTARGQRMQVMICAPRQVAAQVGLSVITGRGLETAR